VQGVREADLLKCADLDRGLAIQRRSAGCEVKAA
jgi:hypothetical protein